MRNSRVALAALVILLGAVPAGAQQGMDTVTIRSTPIAGGIHLLQGRGGNMGLSVGADGAFLVDDQFAPLTARIQAEIAKLTDEPVRFVLNTHWHGDHTGGNENFGKAGALIVAHENVRKRLNPEEFRDVMGRTQQAPAAALPVVTFTDAVTFYWNGDKIRAFHVPPAHTDGDAIIVFTNSDVVHMGDVFFNGGYPFIDTESGGNVNGVIGAADAVLALATPDTKIIPGHGPLAGVAELRAYRDMIASVRDAVSAMIDRGMTEDQVVAARPTQEFDGRFTGNSERFVRAVFQTARVR